MADLEFITALLEVGKFHPSKENVDEELSYLVGEEFSEHICQSAYAGDEQEVRNAVSLLENLANDKDIERQRLIRDVLEGFWASPRRDEISSFFGPNLRKMQQAIKKSTKA
jgi:hypothetical protein